MKKTFNFFSRLCSISHVAECNHSTDNETFKTGINGDLANFPQKRRLYEWCISICTVGHLRQTCLSTAANRRRREDALLTKTFLPKKIKPLNLQFVIFAKVASVVAGRFLAGFFVISLASITPNYISTVAPRCPYRCNGPSGLILLQLRLVHFWGLSLSRFTPLAL